MSTKVKVGLLAGLLLGICIVTGSILLDLTEELEPDEGALTALPIDSESYDSAKSSKARIQSIAPRESDTEPIVPSSGGHILVSGQVVELPFPGLSGEAVPASGVEVEFICEDSKTFPSEWIHPASETTDAEGKYLSEWADSGKRPLRIHVAVEGDEDYRAAHRSVQLKEGGWKIEGLVLERVLHGTLCGETVGIDGNPLAGVRVRFYGYLIGLGWSEAGKDIEVVSDKEGRFQVQCFQGQNNFEAILNGYRQIDASPLEMIDKGGWKLLRLTLAPVSSLALRAVNKKDESVEGIKVQVDISEDEHPAKRVSFFSSQSRESMKGTTDAGGRALFTGVWAEKKLAIDLKYKGNTWHSERMRDGRLVYGEEEENVQAIVVPTQGYIELLVPVPESFRIHGRVVYPGGSPVPEPFVELRHRGANKSSVYRRGVKLRGDQQGHFEHVMISPLLPAKLCLTATDDPDDSSLTWSKASYKNRVTRVLSLNATDGDELYVELVLGPVLSIGGIVLTKDGEPVCGKIYAKPSGSGLVGLPLLKRGSQLSDDGSFHLDGLVPGNYDLYVVQKGNTFFSFGLIEHIFPDIEAGSCGLSLVITESELVKVTLEAHTTKGTVASLRPLMTRYYPPRSVPTSGTVLNPVAKIHRYDGWPRGAGAGLLFGESGAPEESCEKYWYFGNQEGTRYDFKPVSPGWYWIGVRAYDEEGRGFHPTGTDLVYLEPGEYHFRFILDQVGNLGGRIVTETPNPNMCVALVDGSGRAVQTLQGSSYYYDTVSPTGANGSFFLKRAPVGSFLLRIGSDAELRIGAYQHQEEVHVTEGENPHIVVYLP